MGQSHVVIPIRQVKPEDPHARLMAEGWKRQTTIGEPRLSELVQNYRALGYEVHVEGYQAEAGGSGCHSCLDAGEALGQFYGTVYIRRGSQLPDADELF